ncbi:hypothetical protein A1O7_04716 [Cladophialophora yegresii CBS 114405]|uniref:Uncharacterized protein n=1 Tax=Cladophialophora yegresii CBS 114405 TaxID=1182544 RepID=W9VY20_9EURO|nr:uncharacterized protein A1O7_04716 [Cladophialophora yegresii CBS 114405]EXJ60563.1 hypothetical protein A1O7_04716 [Cladophialophora yegresii CBS 114405]
MDTRVDTLSGRFGGQWAFLSSPPTAGSRSVPHSSSYLRSDRSNISPLPTALHFHQLNASRSSLPRHAHAASVGDRSSTTTIPTHPVLVRVHSADPILQVRPTRRPARPRRRPGNGSMDLPAEEEFSIRGILAAIAEDIEDDVDAIAEILGRSRLVLADQHESHMPPQGEIRAISSSLQAVAEASASNERLAAASDDVLILQEDASLVEGSHTGSAAYGLLERLQIVPASRRMRSEIPRTAGSRPATASVRHYSAPPTLPVVPAAAEDMGVSTNTSLPQSSRRLLQSHMEGDKLQDAQPRTTDAVVAETYLSAAANAVTVSDPPVVSEAGRHYPLYSYDYSELFEGPINSPPPVRMTLRERLQSFIPHIDLPNLVSWVHGHDTQVISAESQLREILHRQRPVRGPSSNQGETVESPEMYE